MFVVEVPGHNVFSDMSDGGCQHRLLEMTWDHSSQHEIDGMPWGLTSVTALTAVLLRCEYFTNSNYFRLVEMNSKLVPLLARRGHCSSLEYITN